TYDIETLLEFRRVLFRSLSLQTPSINIELHGASFLQGRHERLVGVLFLAHRVVNARLGLPVLKAFLILNRRVFPLQGLRKLIIEIGRAYCSVRIQYYAIT